MSDILKYTYDVSDINYRYQKIHDDIFSLSVRKMAIKLFSDPNISLQKHADELEILQGKLIDIQTALDALPQSELNIRRGKEILLTLSDYVAALTTSINYLQNICNDKTKLSASDTNLADGRMAYDDAIQYHKNLGVKLNDLLSSF